MAEQAAKIIVAGGRDFIPQPYHWKWLDELREQYALKGDHGIEITEVVHGCQRGADTFGKEWAESWGIEPKPFTADWNRFGNRAGPIRNAEMANYLAAESKRGYEVAVVLFPGGRGTQSMFDEASKRELTIIDWRERTE